jgi:hypothetical protein
MTLKSLLATSAVLTVLAVSSAAQADGCLFRDRTETRVVSTTVQRTDRLFKRVGDTFVRTGDRMLGWFSRRTRT